MILLTGAAGKTGRAVLNALKQKGAEVKAFVRSEKQAADIHAATHAPVHVGDLRDGKSLAAALSGVDVIYFICPNMAPDELEIGQNLLTLAKAKGVTRIVYHSVLHPQVEAMPHHWQKLRLEEAIFTSGLDFTILQPCAYMQNILQYWEKITTEGIYEVPYATSARISIVNLEDVAQAAAGVLVESQHSGAIYELAGPQPLSQEEVAQIIGQRSGRPVHARLLDRNQWAENASKAGMGDYQRNTLLRMFEYYEQFGLVGNSTVLEMLLKRPATSFAEFVERQL